eukprot:8458826-Heterocapsa_arctica.AAC.1
MAARLFGTSANFRPADGGWKPGSLPPTAASMAMRPRLISAWRWGTMFSVLPYAAKPAGSQKPTGDHPPSSFSEGRSGEAV